MVGRVFTSADGRESGAVRSDVAAVLHVTDGSQRDRRRSFGREEGRRRRQGDVRGALCPVGLFRVALPAAALLPGLDEFGQSFGSGPLALPANDNGNVSNAHWPAIAVVRLFGMAGLLLLWCRVVKLVLVHDLFLELLLLTPESIQLVTEGGKGHVYIISQ